MHSIIKTYIAQINVSKILKKNNFNTNNQDDKILFNINIIVIKLTMYKIIQKL